MVTVNVVKLILRRLAGRRLAIDRQAHPDLLAVKSRAVTVRLERREAVEQLERLRSGGSMNGLNDLNPH
jgi:hypothetical protein